MEFKLSDVLELSDENDVKDLVKVTLVNVRKAEEAATKSVLQLNLFRGNEVGFIRSEVVDSISVRWVAVTGDGGYYILTNTVKSDLLERAYNELVSDKINA